MKIVGQTFIIFTLLLSSIVRADDIHEFEKFGIKPVSPWPKVSTSVQTTFATLMANNRIKSALTFLQKDEVKTMDDTITLTEIPAPEFKEERRAKAFAEMLRSAGLTDVKIDNEGNVIGLWKGAGQGPTVVVDAHLDTVFPIDTDVKVKKIDGKYYAPGITDDTRGLAVILSIIRALNQSNIETQGNLIFLGSVGEEGNGDLRGMKAFFKNNKSIDAYIGIESIPFGSIVIQNVGSRRFEVTYTGPGGHSYAAFGSTPNAIHAIGRAIGKISDLRVPSDPKTTFNVGIIKGGRSVNTISDKSTMEIDIRSSDAKELDKTVRQVLQIVKDSAVSENKRWNTSSLEVAIKEIGNRPGGMTSNKSILVEASLGAIKALDQKESILFGSSTNSGIPISLGIPAIQIGPGGKFWGFHALNEGMDPHNAYIGAQSALLTALAIVGVRGVTNPLISR